MKSFGSSVPARVMNPNSNPVKLPDSSSGQVVGINPPRYDWFRKILALLSIYYLFIALSLFVINFWMQFIVNYACLSRLL